MNKREFNKLLNACRTKVKGKPVQKLDPVKLDALPIETRHAMALHIISNRSAVISQFITSLMDMDWLHCMGYLHVTTNAKSGFTFYHTAEQEHMVNRA